MIAKGTRHKDGAILARYLTTSKEREHAELWELRGFACSSIIDAFRSVHVMAAGTRCLAPFFHVYVRNPEGETLEPAQWEHAANCIERMLGLTILPSVSLPTAKATKPAAVAAAGPALEPEAPSSNSHGFMVWPPNQMSFKASAPRLSLAMSTAPAS